MRPSPGATLLAVLAVLAGVPAASAAQSITSASVSGSVTDAADGSGLPRALVSLISLDGAGRLSTVTDFGGAFEFDGVRPGSYEVLVEALGFRPVLARILTVSSGERRTVTLGVERAPPPVLAIDTLALGAAAAGRWHAGGVRVGGTTLRDLPHRLDDLGSLASLSTSSDRHLGSEGLPGSMTIVMADGVPWQRAQHPRVRGERVADLTFPRSSVSDVAILHAAPDVEWAGSAGGYVTLATRSDAGPRALEAEGAWSGGSLWSSGELDIPTPSLSSWQAAARTAFDVAPDTTRITVAAEALRGETPLAARVLPDLADELSGAYPEVAASLAAPSTERISRYSGLVRFDSRGRATSRLFVRGAASYGLRETDGPGPATATYGSSLPEESVEYSLAGGYTSQVRNGLGLEVRAGLSGSDRTFEPSMDLPQAFLAAGGVPLGSALPGPVASSRTDVFLSPIVRLDQGRGVLKAGAVVRAANHSISEGAPGLRSFTFSDASALLAARGVGWSVTPAEASFTTREIGAFGQYEVAPFPGLELSIGGRADYEMIPGSGAERNGNWLATTGLENDDYPSSFVEVGGHASLRWDPRNDGRTRLFLTGSLHYGDIDPSALYEVFGQDVDATAIRFAGTEVAWPAGTFPAGAPDLRVLTLLGPDARPPRSAHLSGGIMREIGGSVALYLGGALRRTDFLMRRRNLNRPVRAVASDAYGRDVFGALVQDGALVSATGPDALRFPDFGPVWALDPDGWSTYRGLTVGVERSGGPLDLFASYTRSKTEDNWVGAAQDAPGARLSPLLPEGDDWSEGPSDFDVPDRVAVGAVLQLARVSLAATYRYASGLSFTPGYRLGVDANGDGSWANDVAFVPDASELGALASEWSCLESQAGSFAQRNSCRGPARQYLDARLSVHVATVGNRGLSLVLEGFDLLEHGAGVIDDALLLVDPDAAITTSPDGSTVTVPVMVNPSFGRIIYPSTLGRMLRLGFSVR